MIVIGDVTVHHGNCLDVLATMGDCTVHSVVTDPPYELGFMGKDWDNSGIAYRVDLWREVLRVLKPGGHLLAFGATRTYHRMAVAIEDAGFEIRDSIHWIYASGFPKSHDVSKGIDKVNGEPDRLLKFTAWMRTTGLTSRQIDEITDTNMGGHYLTAKSQPAIPTAAMWQVLRPHCGEVPDWVDALVARIEAEREVIGSSKGVKRPGFAGETYGPNGGEAVTLDITAAATDAAKQWEGWGTALKPAHEPIVVARRPLIGTVAANVLEHGTGALNIDGARIGGESTLRPRSGGDFGLINDDGWKPSPGVNGSPLGRWPANVIFDPDAAAELDRQSGVSRDGVAVRHRGVKGGTIGPSGAKPEGTADMGYGGQGGASRFFYVAKPSKAERNAGLEGLPERNKYKAGGVGGTGGWRDVDKAINATPVANVHPTVKPLQLMRYLVRLVTPPGGTVLEPFAGSGTTLMAATIEGFTSIGIEMTDDYLPIIEGRVRWAQQQQQELW